MRKRAGWFLSAFAVLLVLGTATVVQGDHGPDAHSKNMTLIANLQEAGKDALGQDANIYRAGTDLAFWGNTLIAGNLDQSLPTPRGGFRVIDISDPTEPKQVGKLALPCGGDQSDVSVWKDIVILSVDKPSSQDCSTTGNTWEGVRIVSIADPAKPTILKSIPTPCGSHTHTIVPDRANERLFVYVLSYPLAGRYNPPQVMGSCLPGGHGKITVLEVPLESPGDAKVAHEPTDAPRVDPAIGCHDVTVFLERSIAAAACLTESQIWDISDPAKPTIKAHIPNPVGMNLSHSTVFSNDGRTLVIGDELGGAAASPGCLTGSQEDRPGGLFFYDVTDAAAPELVHTYKLPRSMVSEFCTAHLFNVVPMPDEQDVLVSSWYTGATSVIDFSRVRDGVAPTEVGYYVPAGQLQYPEQLGPSPTDAAAWASYWYRGYIWTSNFDEDVNSVKQRSRGLDVFRLDDPLVKKALKLPRLNPQVQERLPQSTR